MNEKPKITSDIRNNYKLSHNYCSGDPWPHDNQAGAGVQAVSAEFQAPLGATVISITDNRRHCYNGHPFRTPFIPIIGFAYQRSSKSKILFQNKINSVLNVYS